MTPSNDRMLTAALQLVQHGLPVFPVHGIVDGRCGCGNERCENPGKHPMTEHGFHDATLDEAKVRRCWSERPEANIAVPTGAKTFTALDVDPRHGGLDSLRDLEREGLTLPETWKVKTGGGGFHSHMQRSPEWTVGASGRAAILPGLDVKDAGGYVIVPPSLHVSGKRYEWIHGPLDGTQLAAQPGWLLELRRRGARPSAVAPSENEPLAPLLYGVSEGQRDEAITREAWRLAQSGIPVDVAMAAIFNMAAQCQPPFDSESARQKVLRAYSKVETEQVDIQSQPRLRVRPVGEFLSEPEPNDIWLWELYIPGQGALVVLASFMKVGKTTFLYALLAAIATGEPFMGLATTQTRVLILAVEERERDVRNRLRELGLEEGHTIPIDIHTGDLPADEATLAELEKTIQDKGYGLVALDTITNWWDVRDENDNAGVRQAILPLLQVARRTGATFLLVHHTSKKGGKGGRELRGASSLLGLVDQALVLQNKGAPTHRLLTALGRYGSPPTVLIEFDQENYSYRRLDNTNEAIDAGNLATVRGALEGTGWLTVEAITEATDVGARGVRKALKKLQLDRRGDGVRNDPYEYRLLDSFPAQPAGAAMGPETSGAGMGSSLSSPSGVVPDSFPAPNPPRGEGGRNQIGGADTDPVSFPALSEGATKGPETKRAGTDSSPPLAPDSFPAPSTPRGERGRNPSGSVPGCPEADGGPPAPPVWEV